MKRLVLILQFGIIWLSLFGQPSPTGTTSWQVFDGNSVFILDVNDLVSFFSTTGIPIGGTTGQVLTKNSATDYDVSWQTPSGGGGSVATDAIFDAKGDLPVGTGANTAARLPVGTDGMQLYAQSSESTGLKWGKTSITPAQITSDQDNYSPAGWATAQIVNVSGDNGLRAITSFAATFDGDEKTLYNVGTQPIYIPGEHPDGTAENRVSLRSDYIIMPLSGVTITYNGTNSRWNIKDDYNDIGIATQYYSWNPGSTTAGDNNEIVFSVIGTGAVFVTATASSGIPGHHSGTTGSTATGTTHMAFPKTVAEGYYHGNGHFYFDAVWQVATLSDASDTYFVLQTLEPSPAGTVAGGAPNAGAIGIRYSHGNNAGKLEGFSKSSGGAESVVDLGVTVAASTTYFTRIELNKENTEARFYVNGLAKGRVSSNLPTAQSFGTRLMMQKTVGTGSRGMRYISMRTGAIYPY